CIIYTGTKEFVKFAFPAGEGEAAAVVEGLAKSESFAVSLVSGKEKAELTNISQEVFAKGTNPEVTTEDYSNAFAAVEPYVFNTICVDTEDTVIHLLLAAFLNRIFEAGSLAQGVVAEGHTTDLEKRVEHAQGFNDEKMHYVLNAWVNEEGKEIDGYQTAARIAGMIGACASNSSLTHTVINGFTNILERLTNTQVVEAEQKGCLVLSVSSKNQVWIDNAINTLTVFTEDKDEGWRKIRRVKARFELIRRINDIMDNLVGKVDNDSNGRNTIISQMQGVGNAMVQEGKLVSCKVEENAAHMADGDSAWFNIDVIDKDSAEHLYMIFRFQFSTNE
ncbi:MAG: phage tail sheath subtilisin-like domain-containing protein, partial [Lachnospiraceae bacterium]|nr:phage tail sheath subtilisin-like domain-containing protein [Lachnospiraceae bacterium]